MGFLIFMATIFRRIKHLKLNPDQETKIKIGKEVCDTYFAQERKAKVFKIQSVEPEGTFEALSYPKSFNHVIDKIILKHCVPKAKRPRLNKIFTAKPK